MIEYIPVGNLGGNMGKFLEKVNKKVGKGNWFWGFRGDKRLYSWEWGMQLLEDSYFQHFRNNINNIKEIVKYGNVYIFNNSDLAAGLDYKKRDQEKDYYYDIAIRRCLVRLGVWFKGKDLLSLSESNFSDSKVTFHLPHLVHKPDEIKSVRAWLYTNRLIIVAQDVADKARLSEILVR